MLTLRRTGAGRTELDREAAEEEARWNALSTKEKISDWGARHQYSIIVGSWVLSMAVAGSIIAKDRFVARLHRRLMSHDAHPNLRHQTMTQKVVQVRMWAQGLTIGVLIGAGILTHSQRQAALQHVSSELNSSPWCRYQPFPATSRPFMESLGAYSHTVSHQKYSCLFTACRAS